MTHSSRDAIGAIEDAAAALDAEQLALLDPCDGRDVGVPAVVQRRLGVLLPGGLFDVDADDCVHHPL